MIKYPEIIYPFEPVGPATNKANRELFAKMMQGYPQPESDTYYMRSAFQAVTRFRDRMRDALVPSEPNMKHIARYFGVGLLTALAGAKLAEIDAPVWTYLATSAISLV